MPKSVIRQSSNSVKICFEYHTTVRAVKYWAIAGILIGDDEARMRFCQSEFGGYCRFNRLVRFSACIIYDSFFLEFFLCHPTIPIKPVPGRIIVESSGTGLAGSQSGSVSGSGSGITAQSI